MKPAFAKLRQEIATIRAQREPPPPPPQYVFVQHGEPVPPGCVPIMWLDPGAPSVPPPPPRLAPPAAAPPPPVSSQPDARRPDHVPSDGSYA